MKSTTHNWEDIMNDVLDEVVSKRQEVKISEPEPKEPEKEETLDQLVKGWKNAQPAREEPKPLVWNENTQPLEKKEEVYTFFKRRIITGPYLCIILEHVFKVPHDVAYEVEADLIKGGFVPGHIRLMDKIAQEVGLWKRVVATCERDGIEDFIEDARHILRNRLSVLNGMIADAERRELRDGESTVRNSYKRKRT